MGPCAALLLLFAAPPTRGGAAGQEAAAVERHLQQAVRAAPGSFEAQHNLGEFYIQQGRLKAAIPPLEKASAIDPSHYVNGYDLALAYLQLSRLPQAREQIRRLLQVRETAELHDLLGEVAEKSGDLAAAAEAYRRAAQMDPSEEHLFDWGNSLGLGFRGRGHFICVSDAVDIGRRLDYGDSIRRGRFRCRSRVTGMRCVNLRNGHGFALSRQRVRRF